MPDSQTSNMKTILVLVAVAIVVAVVVTLLQTLILGKSNTAITGGVVGAMVVALGLSSRRKRSS
jgi:hypothetical protein